MFNGDKNVRFAMNFVLRAGEGWEGLGARDSGYGTPGQPDPLQPFEGFFSAWHGCLGTPPQPTRIQKKEAPRLLGGPHHEKTTLLYLLSLFLILFNFFEIHIRNFTVLLGFTIMMRLPVSTCIWLPLCRLLCLCGFIHFFRSCIPGCS